MINKVNKSKIGGALVLSVIVMTLFLSLCAYNNVFPFGNNSLCIIDAGQQIVPMYYGVWDFLHGQKSLIFDWYTGLGNNLIGDVIHYGLASPLNLLLYFTSRANIERFFTILLLVRFILIGLSIYYFISKHFRVLPVWVIILLSLIYTFNGFTIPYMIFPMWLDVVIIFPLLISALIDLINNKSKGLWYTVLLFIALTLDLTISVMLVIFIILFSFMYINLMVDKQDRNKAIIRMIIYSVIAAMLSAFLLLPGAIQILNSQRMETGFLTQILDGYNKLLYTDMNKWLMGVTSIVPLVIGWLILISKKLSNKAVKSTLLIWTVLTSVMTLSIVVEGSNLVWHLGSYSMFPMRFAFMLQFTSVLILSVIINEAIENEENLINPKACTTMLVLAVVFCAYVLLKTNNAKWVLCITSMQIIGITLIMCLGVLFITKIKALRYQAICIIVALCSVFITVTNFAVANPLTLDAETAYPAESINNMVTDSDPFNRIKNVDNSIQSNYPLIVRRSAMSNYLHIVNSKQIDFTVALGYNQIWTRMNDTGGTLISDGLINYTSAFAKQDLDESLYTYVGKSNNDLFNVYDTKYQIPLGIIINQTAVDRPLDNNNQLGNQQIMAEQIMNDTSLWVTSFHNDEPIHELNITNKSVVYFVASCDDVIEIKVNGQTVVVNPKSLTNINMYPQEEYRGILDLGVYENQDVQIELVNNSGLDYWATIGVLDLSSFKNSIDRLPNNKFTYQFGDTSLDLSINSNEEGKYLFLPIYNDEGWNCSVNGKKVQISSVFDTLMAIPLDKGDNVIHLSYMPPYMKQGMVISAIGLILLILCLWKAKQIEDNKVIGKIGYYMLVGCAGIITIAIVVLPIIFMGINIIKNIV